MADGRHLGNIEKSSYLNNSLTDGHEIWHLDVCWPSWPSWPIRNLNIENTRSATILKDRKITISHQRFDGSPQNLARWRSFNLLTLATIKSLKFKNLRWRRPPFWKIQISPYLSNGLTGRHKIWHPDTCWLSWPFRPWKIWNFENCKSNTAACRNVYGGCMKYLLRNILVIEFGQVDSEILYNDTQPKYKIAHISHKIAHITHFKIKQILTGKDGPLKLH